MGVKRASWQRGALSLRNGIWTLRFRQAMQFTGEDSIEQKKTFRVGSSRDYRTKAAARLAADRLLERMGSGPVNGRAIHFGTFAEIYLTDQLAVMQRTTVAAYRSILRHHLVPVLRDVPMHEISGRKPAAVVTALVKAQLSRSSIRAAMGVLGRMLDVAAQMGYASVPLNRRTYRLPPAAAYREQRCFTPEESRKIILAVNYPWRAFYALMAYAGLRCSEALGIEWSHVDLIGRQLRIRQAAAMGKLKTVKSRNSAADLPISEQLHAILLEYRDSQAYSELAGGLLFPSPRGGPYWASAVYRTHFTPLLKRIGIPPAGLHAFRHGAATNLFAGGASAPTVRAMLRHGDIKTTMRYSHTTSMDMRLAAQSVGKLIGNAVEN